MIHFYTNRQMAARLGINLSRWKRWSREFLPPDPLGGLQSGLARQYTIAEAFTVYLCGYLVARLNFSIPEARKIVDDLSPTLKTLGCLDGSGAKPETAASSPGDLATAHIRIWRLPASGAEPVRFGYQLRQRLQSSGSKGESPRVVVERVRETDVGGSQTTPPAGPPRSWRTLDVGLLHRWFTERISQPAA
jgi:hypothetical protein